MSAKNKTIQQKISHLNDQVAWFQGEDFKLEEALDRFRLAEKTAEEIEHDLKDLKNEVIVLKNKFSEDE